MTSEKGLRARVISRIQRVELAFSNLEYWKSRIDQLTQLELQRRKEISALALQNELACIQSEYLQKYNQLFSAIDQVASGFGLSELEWSASAWKQFKSSFTSSIPCLTRFGLLEKQGRFSKITMPALLPIIGGRNVVLLAQGDSKNRTRQVMRSIVLRLLATLPPGKLRLVCIDPVELGSTVAGFTKGLPDTLTGGYAWYTQMDIEQHLANLEDHIAFVKQKYLGASFINMQDYNQSAGQIEEPYRLLVISDFPARFSDLAAQHLISIATSGPSTGVYTLIMVDEDQGKLPHGFNLEDLKRTASIIKITEQTCTWLEDGFQDCMIQLDAPPSSEVFEKIVTEVKQATFSAEDIRLPFEILDESKWWLDDAREKLEVPIGQFGAREIQLFMLAQQMLNSALIVGKTGSGKSTLLHILITGLTMRYSPDEVELYLLDFKQVEFKDYAIHRLPHARVVAVKSEREFGLSVLVGLDHELQRRKDIFGNQPSLSQYRNRTGQKQARIILMADEFQELFSEDDILANTAATILDRLIRQGRAFGIHVLLSSQTLAGANTISATLRNQISVRIALQCAETDSRLILSEDNDRARLLERPGEAIYNSSNGRLEGNNRFQIFWLTHEDRVQLLQKMRIYANQFPEFATREPLVFDGEASSDLENNHHLQALSNAGSWPVLARGHKTQVWIGEPIQIKDHTVVTFRRQSRSNFIIIGQNEYEKEVLGMLLAAQISQAVQQDPQQARFVLLNLVDVDAEWYGLADKIKQVLPHEVRVAKRRNILDIIDELYTEVKHRIAQEDDDHWQTVYFFIWGLHRVRDLRREESYSSYDHSDDVIRKVLPAEQMSAICREGPNVGVHTLCWCDTYANFERVFERREINEFDLRVALQMGADDSRNFIDSEMASRLGDHRALFYDVEHSKQPEKFRPYGLPSIEWLDNLERALKHRKTNIEEGHI